MKLHQWLVIGSMAGAVIVPVPGLAQGPAGADAPVSSLTVVIDDNYPPYSFRDANGALLGIRKDMWDQWSARTGVPVYLEGLDWGQALAR
ncbi:MAG TPA: transporter substrate-binding domain-containing protein, partial [Burkholderiales bacterium]|nr:transporter substrate-binding domain-containing protein [Burkholderiales bacterium]